MSTLCVGFCLNADNIFNLNVHDLCFICSVLWATRYVCCIFGLLLLSLMVQSVIHVPGGSTINSGLHALSWQHQSVIHVPHPVQIFLLLIQFCHSHPIQAFMLCHFILCNTNRGAENVMGLELCLRNKDHIVIVMRYFPHQKFQVNTFSILGWVGRICHRHALLLTPKVPGRHLHLFLFLFFLGGGCHLSCVTTHAKVPSKNIQLFGGQGVWVGDVIVMHYFPHLKF